MFFEQKKITLESLSSIELIVKIVLTISDSVLGTRACAILEATRLEILDVAPFYESRTLGIVAHAAIRIGVHSVSPLVPQFLEGRWSSPGEHGLRA